VWSSQRPEALSRRAAGYAAFLQDALTKDRADKTISGHAGQWKMWSEFASAEGFCRLPASPFHVALFLVHRFKGAASRGETQQPVVKSADAIGYVHLHCALADPTKATLPQAVVHFAYRQLARPPTKSKRLTAEILAKLATTFADSTDHGWRMIYVALLIGFAGFLRWDDMMHVDLAFVVFESDHMRLFVEKSKTDQTRVGHWVVVAVVEGALCPVTNLQRFMRMAGVTSGPLLRRVVRTKNGCTVSKYPLSYSRFLCLMREALMQAGLSPAEAQEFGTRCMRTGGATAAAEFGVPDRLRLSHGRWQSETVGNGYVQDSLAQLLLVTRNLGLARTSP